MTVTDDVGRVLAFSDCVLISPSFSLSLVCIPISSVSSDPPTFAKPEQEELKLSAGSKIILNCTATGNPVPVYSWHFPHPMQLTSKNQNADQPILTPSIQLPGTYNCSASNSQGIATKYFTVVEAPSKIF